MVVNTKIRPIDTVYNYRNYRSRLEARWAVFFDTLGILYEYEYEGYMLPDGSWYLPDFLMIDKSLPYGQFLVEVKPELEECSKCHQLGVEGDKPVVMVGGTPLNYHCMLYAPDITKDKIVESGYSYLCNLNTTYPVDYLTTMIYDFPALTAETYNTTIPLDSNQLKLHPKANDLLGDFAVRYIAENIHIRSIVRPFNVAVEAAMKERF